MTVSKRKHQLGAILLWLFLSTGVFADTTQNCRVDPFEKINRVMFDFNEIVDKWVLIPIATIYNAVLPKPVNKAISNFFNNIDMIPTVLNDGDVVIFMNYRADRAREITRAFVDPNFNGFKRTKTVKLAEFVSLTEYDKTLNTEVAFTPTRLDNILAAYISDLGLKQLRIAETEKYAHVTFFFNGGIETPYPGEDRVLIPSPKVATYDLKPEMSAPELTDRLVKEIQSNRYDLIICNFANPDMVGHTGNFDAAVKAIETIDTCLGKIITALKQVGGEAIITADHGNAELMFDEKTGQAHTAHTHELVPCLYIGRKANIIKNNGVLADIAPTLLTLMGLPIPPEMTGQPILKLS